MKHGRDTRFVIKPNKNPPQSLQLRRICFAYESRAAAVAYLLQLRFENKVSSTTPRKLSFYDARDIVVVRMRTTTIFVASCHNPRQTLRRISLSQCSIMMRQTLEEERSSHQTSKVRTTLLHTHCFSPFKSKRMFPAEKSRCTKPLLCKRAA